jgi:hypothetical protein
MTDQRPRVEEFEVDGDKVLSKIKEIVHAGNVRRITIKNDDGKTLIEIPLTVGVVVGLLVPVLAAVGAIAAVVTRCIIVVERIEESE